MLDRRTVLLGLGASLAAPFVRPSSAATQAFGIVKRRQRLWIPSDGAVAGNGVNPTVLGLQDGSFLAGAVSTVSGATFVQRYDAQGKLRRRLSIRRLGEFGNTLCRESTFSRRVVLLSASTDGLSAFSYDLDENRFKTRVRIFADDPAFFPAARSINDKLDLFFVSGPLIGGPKSVQRVSYDDSVFKSVDAWAAGTSIRPEVKVLAVSGAHLLTVEYNEARTDFGYRVRKLSLSDAPPVYGKSFRGRDVPRSGAGIVGIRSQEAFAFAWSGGGRLGGNLHDASGLVKLELKPVADPGRIVPGSPGTTPMIYTGGRILAFSRTGSAVAWNLAGQVVAGPTPLDIGSPVEVQQLTSGNILVASTDRSGGKSYLSIVSFG